MDSSARDAGHPFPRVGKAPAAVFVARDAEQCRHLLYWLGRALELESLVSYVAEHAYEGADTSLYLLSFYDVGWGDGYRRGRERGVDLFYEHNADAVARRADAAREARKPAKAARRRNRKAGKR